MKNKIPQMRIWDRDIDPSCEGLQIDGIDVSSRHDIYDECIEMLRGLLYAKFRMPNDYQKIGGVFCDSNAQYMYYIQMREGCSMTLEEAQLFVLGFVQGLTKYHNGVYMESHLIEVPAGVTPYYFL